MSVKNGQLANQDTFNNGFLDKNEDTTMPNKMSMTDPDEGGDIDSVQGSINEIFDTQGTSEGDANAKVYANTNYIADGDSQKTAIEKLDAQAGVADGDLTSHVADLTAHRNFDTLANLTTWAATADNGWFAFATDTKQSFQVIDGALEPIGGGGGLNYLGTWDASTNTPTLPVGDESSGDFYVVNVAGTQDIGNGAVDWAVGDWAIYNDLTGFLKIDNSDLVSSVNGQTGAVVLDADDIAETTSRYWDVKNNRTATTNPTVTNDDSENYAQGSTWLNTSTGTMYVCTDASTGAAVWKIQSGSDSKNTRWGNVNRNTISSSDWVTTGDAVVTDSSLDGSIQDSFRVDTGTAGNTATIEHVIPPAAIDVRYNQAVIEYQLYDINDPVICTVLDWNDNKIGQVELPKTGSAPALADNIRFAHATVGFTFPYAHGSTFRSVKFQFECASDINAGEFLVNFIQSDSNPRSIGQWVEVNSVSLSGNGGETITGGTENIVFNGTGTGWNSSTYEYKVQKNGSTINLSAGFFIDSSSANVYRVYVNGTFYRNLTVGSLVTRLRQGSIVIPSSDISAGDLIQLRTSSTVTLSNDSNDHYLNITETANRRSIMAEADRVPDIVTAKVTPTDVIENENFEGFITGYSNSAGTVTLTFAEQEDPPTIQATHISAADICQPRDMVVTTTSATWVQRSTSGSTIPSNLSWNVAICRSAKDIGGLKQAISIPVDEIIADGNEYAVFGKFITVGGVKYQVFRRSAIVSTDNSDLYTIGTTAKPINDWGKQDSDTWRKSFATANGTNTEFTRLNFEESTGVVSTRSSGYTNVGVIATTDYYDTARPLYS